jgi:hypothetical protein
MLMRVRPGSRLAGTSRGAAVLGCVLVALAPSATANAQDEGGGGVQVGGSVSSFLSLGFTEPHGFASFPSAPVARTTHLSVDLHITGTAQRTQLTVADGDAAAGPTRGRLVDGSSALTSPIGLAVDSGFASLDAPIDPLLATWTQPIGDEPAVLQLRQLVPRVLRRRGPYRKLVLVTISASAP